MEHDWQLVGPWYRWTSLSKALTTADGRRSRPEIQKYASSDPVTAFLEEPQRSLIYLDEDFIQEVVTNGANKYSLSNTRLQSTDLRKLYLDTHNRFYLVVAELHCDLPGFPCVSREQVCSAGFVIRRWIASVAPGVQADVRTRLDAIEKARMQIEFLDQKEAEARRKARRTAWSDARESSWRRKRAEIGMAAATARRELRALWAEGAVSLDLQGWIPGDTPGFGSWQPVEATPDAVSEEVQPLYPLIPDPDDHDHSARGKSIWFGIIPTGSADVDPVGNSKYDDRAIYEICCFVRRRRGDCTKPQGAPTCKGQLVWSRPTKPYRLAAHFDLLGTSNRPINIQLPDIPTLKAQADSLEVGQGAAVRMLSPPKSDLGFKIVDGEPTNPNAGGPSICSFPIPLITIVATFVLRLFLPVVVFLFGLWFLLRLKFCILPSFSVDADLAAALKADLDADLDIGATAAVDLLMSDIELENALLTPFEGIHDEMREKIKADLQDPLDNHVLLNRLGRMVVDLSTDFSNDLPPDLSDEFDGAPTGAPEESLPRATSRLRYYERREMTV